MGKPLRERRKGKSRGCAASPRQSGKPCRKAGRAAPLCQITVRIGEEAIVKRRISETDLRLQPDGGGGVTTAAAAAILGGASADHAAGRAQGGALPLAGPAQKVNKPPSFFREPGGG